MQSIKVHQRVGTDGILHLEIPTEIQESEVEVTVTYQKLPPQEADDPIVIDDNGISEALDNGMEGAISDENIRGNQANFV